MRRDDTRSMRKKKWNWEEWKAWFQAQPASNAAMTAIIGVILAFLLVGIVVAAFRFLWSAIILIGLIALALAAVAKMRQQGVKVPIALSDYRYRKGRPERAEARRKRPL